MKWCLKIFRNSRKFSGIIENFKAIKLKTRTQAAVL